MMMLRIMPNGPILEITEVEEGYQIKVWDDQPKVISEATANNEVDLINFIKEYSQ